MNAKQVEELKQVIDAYGWNGVREMRPDLWAAFQKDRNEARKAVDADEKAECLRVGC